MLVKWIHLFPSRTQKLSTSAPTIVYAKIGDCKSFFLPYFVNKDFFITKKNKFIFYLSLLLPYIVYIIQH